MLSPYDDTVWASGTSSQTIAWEAVSTDPESFQVQIVNQVCPMHLDTPMGDPPNPSLRLIVEGKQDREAHCAAWAATASMPKER